MLNPADAAPLRVCDHEYQAAVAKTAEDYLSSVLDNFQRLHPQKTRKVNVSDAAWRNEFCEVGKSAGDDLLDRDEKAELQMAHLTLSGRTSSGTRVDIVVCAKLQCSAADIARVRR